MRERKTKAGWLAEVIQPKIIMNNPALSRSPPGDFVVGHKMTRDHHNIPVWGPVLVPVGSFVIVLKPQLCEVLFDGAMVVIPKSCVRRVDDT